MCGLAAGEEEEAAAAAAVVEEAAVPALEAARGAVAAHGAAAVAAAWREVAVARALGVLAAAWRTARLRCHAHLARMSVGRVEARAWRTRARIWGTFRHQADDPVAAWRIGPMWAIGPAWAIDRAVVLQAVASRAGHGRARELDLAPVHVRAVGVLRPVICRTFLTCRAVAVD
jgi:hypothetical protein